jgi:hypothetical protein
MWTLWGDEGKCGFNAVVLKYLLQFVLPTAVRQSAGNNTSRIVSRITAVNLQYQGSKLAENAFEASQLQKQSEKLQLLFRNAATHSCSN